MDNHPPQNNQPTQSMRMVTIPDLQRHNNHFDLGIVLPRNQRNTQNETHFRLPIRQKEVDYKHIGLMFPYNYHSLNGLKMKQLQQLVTRNNLKPHGFKNMDKPALQHLLKKTYKEYYETINTLPSKSKYTKAVEMFEKEVLNPKKNTLKHYNNLRKKMGELIQPNPN